MGDARGKPKRAKTAVGGRSAADVQLSKALSWVLRHAAPSVGLRLMPDGYVPVDEVVGLDHSRFRAGGRPKYTVDDVVRVVETNDKRRFRLDYREVTSWRRVGGSRRKDEEGNDHLKESGKNDGGNSRELGQRAGSDEVDTEGSHSNQVLCIRANQGHSLKGLQSDQLLTPLTRAELSDPSLTIVHGTTRKAWEQIRHEGLSRMRRNHVHFATGLPAISPSEGKVGNGRDKPAPISGMRASSEVYIYVDGRKCAEDGIPFYRSDNGVILTAGVDEKGMLSTEYFERVVCASTGKELWKQGPCAVGK